VPAARAAEVVKENDFQSMQERERNGAYAAKYGEYLTPGDVNDIDSYKVRKGRIGSYREELSPDDAAFCNEQLRQTGYLEAMTKHPEYRPFLRID
jgi:hypothetical protein